jgi:hypothetical protein
MQEKVKGRWVQLPERDPRYASTNVGRASALPAKLSMALTPELFARLVEDQPYLYHVTQIDHVPAILREGLRPASEHGQPRDVRFWAPRPGHVYLFTSDEQAFESARYQDEELGDVSLRQPNRPVVLRIETAKLDPARFKADEDFFFNMAAPSGFSPAELDEATERRKQVGYPELPPKPGPVGWEPVPGGLPGQVQPVEPPVELSLGEWAEQVGLDSPYHVWDSHEMKRLLGSFCW